MICDPRMNLCHQSWIWIRRRFTRRYLPVYISGELKFNYYSGDIQCTCSVSPVDILVVWALSGLHLEVYDSNLASPNFLAFTINSGQINKLSEDAVNFSFFINAYVKPLETPFSSEGSSALNFSSSIDSNSVNNTKITMYVCCPHFLNCNILWPKAR